MAPLFNLPRELFQMVVDQLDNISMIRLRSTCMTATTHVTWENLATKHEEEYGSWAKKVIGLLHEEWIASDEE